MMYTETKTCPYRDECETYQTIIRIERQATERRRELALNRTQTSQREYETALDDLQKRLDSTIKIRERCLNRHRRCLKYWMIRKQREADQYTLLAHDNQKIPSETPQTKSL
jgi:hypothetical protein